MMITVPEKIETRKTPLKGKELKEAEAYIRRFFDGDSLTLDTANSLYQDFFGKGMHGKFKTEKMDNAVNDFLFTAAGSFDKWFSLRPPDAQKILYAATFEEFVDIELLEKALNIKIKFVKEKWGREHFLDTQYNLAFLAVLKNDDGTFCIGMRPLHRSAVLPQFIPPPEALLENCVCAEDHDAVPYNNSTEIAESIPLFCGALNEVLANWTQDKNIRRAFAKTTVNKLYAASGFRHFPFETDKALAPYSPLAADILAHFLLFMTEFRILPKVEDPAEFLRGFLKQFLGVTAAKDSYDYRYWTSGTIEFNIFFTHLLRTSISSYSQRKASDIYSLRGALAACLLAIAKDGRTLDACALVEQLKYSGKRLSFFPADELRYLKIRADEIHLFGKEMERRNSWDDFNPTGILRFDFTEKPLFFGYLYVCACLGILEITQAPPPLVCQRGDKKLPISIFDSLKTVKITEFGRWCLGLSSEPPAMEKSKYEAIADNELFLVTVRGKSLERTIFLDRIGEKLGTDRWRINPSTFISGCENRAQIEERIKKFHDLIEENPAPHWEKLFKTVLERTTFLDNQHFSAIVYRLPFDTPARREASTELLADPELRGIAMRAEGGLLVIPYLNEKRFYALLAAHGIAHFETHR
jgi:hypothetical protein